MTIKSLTFKIIKKSIYYILLFITYLSWYNTKFTLWLIKKLDGEK
jgi:hypothetical protein